MEAAIHLSQAEILRQEHVVLRDVSLDVLPGQMVYLIGPVGCGKTSLIKTLYAEVPLEQAREASVLGYDLLRLRRRDIPMLRRQIGVVFQDFQLLTDRSVEANLDFVLRATGMADRAARRERIASTLLRVGMDTKAYKMPHELSGGEQQRVVIARALINHPRLILADEPTGNLDPDTAHQLIGQLHDIALAGTPVVVATHNHALIDTFPGRVLECRDHLVKEI